MVQEGMERSEGSWEGGQGLMPKKKPMGPLMRSLRQRQGWVERWEAEIRTLERKIAYRRKKIQDAEQVIGALRAGLHDGGD